MKKKKKTKKPKYGFAIGTLSEQMKNTLFILSVLLMLGVFTLIITFYCNIFEQLLVFIIVGIYTSLTILASIIWFMSRRIIVYISKPDSMLEKNCVLCLSEIESDQLYVFCPFCKEPMHFSELTNWLKVKTSCPNCLKEFKKVSFRKRIVDVSNSPKDKRSLENMLNDS